MSRATKWCAEHQMSYWSDISCPKCSMDRLVPFEEKAPDPVNRPPHYNQGEIECLDAMVLVFGEDAVKTYAKVAAFKYLWRHRYKGKEAEDLEKGAFYLRYATGDDPRK